MITGLRTALQAVVREYLLFCELMSHFHGKSVFWDSG